MAITTRVAVAEENSAPFSAANGLIQQYYTNSGTTVSVDNFVEFVNSTASSSEKYGTPTSMFNNTVYAEPFTSAIKLNSTQALVAFAQQIGGYDSSNEAFKVYSFTFSGGTITPRYIQLNPGYTYGEERISITKVSSTRVLCTVSWDDASYEPHTVAYMLTVSSNGTISAGTGLTLNETSIDFGVRLTNGYVSLFGLSYHTGGSTPELVINTSGSTPSVYTTKTTTYSQVQGMAPTVLSDGRVLILNNKSNNIYAQILTPSSSGVTWGTETLVLSIGKSDAWLPKSIPINRSDSRFLCGVYSYSAGQIFAWIVTVSGSTITTYSSINCASISYPNVIIGYPGVSLIPVGETEGVVQYVYQNYDNYTTGPYVYIKTFTINSNNTLSNLSGGTLLYNPGYNMSDSSAALGAIEVGDSGIYTSILQLGYNYGSTVGDGRYSMRYSLINTGKMGQMVQHSTSKIDGIALSNGSSTSAANILVLNK